TVCIRPSEWAFASRPLDIDVDPLPIAGACRELIDAVLVHRYPVGNPQRAADKLRGCCNAVAWYCHGHSLWERAQILAQDLADRGFGHPPQKAPLLGHLVCRKLPPAVRDHTALAHSRSRRLDQEQPPRLAGLLVGRPDAGAFDGSGAGGSDRLDLVRVDV